MFARIGIMRALSRHVERLLDSSPKNMRAIDAVIPSIRYCSR
jgi:hypothetical protein